MGKRRRSNHPSLSLALEELRSKKISLRKAARKYDIAKSTLSDRLLNNHRNANGRPTALSKELEESVASRVILLAEWGFPITSEELKTIVHDILQRANVSCDRFKNNMPGDKWIRNFLARHKLSKRMTSNISKKRAETTEETLIEYFKELKKSLEDVPPENIINYDETNMNDDPGKQKSIVRRGMKYPERIMNHSKAGTSVMFAGSAIGDLLPPYVVYKAQNIYKEWTVGGPDGARYTATKSGWFDERSFEDWFEKIALAYLRRKEGAKVLIGDNLSSHLSEKVIESCKLHDIRFICLPPNTTHLTQPLDRAFFGPLKKKWRSILTQYRNSPTGKKYTTLPKNQFPKLLKNLVEVLNCENLRSGFRACGIHPYDPDMVISALPSTCVESSVDEVIIQHLKELRGPETPGPSGRRRTKLNVKPGRSVGQEENSDESEHSDDEDMDDNQDGDDDKIEVAVTDQENTYRYQYQVDDLVWANYEGASYPGQVKQIAESEIQVTTMIMLERGHWKWPDSPRSAAAETAWYVLAQVSPFNEELTVVNNRGHFSVTTVTQR